jgi:signal transduction histidine kinase
VLERAEASGDPALVQAAAEHREELNRSVLQSRRYEFLLHRALAVFPVLALLFGVVLVLLAVLAARSIARGLSRPVGELAEWAGRIARGEPLPSVATAPARAAEFGVLRDAFRRMADDLSASRARELEAERTRTWMAMARNVAHELKNPLTPIRFAVRALQRGAAGPAAHEALEVLAEESGRLEELARGFAQFGRLPEGPASAVDLGELLGGLLRSHLPPNIAHRLSLPEQLPPVHGHADALGRAFANLLLNAVDAIGERGGEIRVGGSLDRESVEVRIADTGPGIPEENLRRIWEPDFSTKARGTGLGLALVRQTVLAHGGSCEARNLAGGGAEFRVRLPLAPETSLLVRS